MHLYLFCICICRCCSVQYLYIAWNCLSDKQCVLRLYLYFVYHLYLCPLCICISAVCLFKRLFCISLYLVPPHLRAHWRCCLSDKQCLRRLRQTLPSLLHPLLRAEICVNSYSVFLNISFVFLKKSWADPPISSASAAAGFY